MLSLNSLELPETNMSKVGVERRIYHVKDDVIYLVLQCARGCHSAVIHLQFDVDCVENILN